MIYSVSRIRGIHIFSVFQAAAIPLIGYQYRNPKRLTHAMVVVGGARYLPPSILVVPYNLFKLRRSQRSRFNAFGESFRTSQSKATAERIGQRSRTLPAQAARCCLHLIFLSAVSGGNFSCAPSERLLDDEESETSSQLTLPELAEYFEFLVFTPRE